MIGSAFWNKLNGGTKAVIINTGNNPTSWISTNLQTPVVNSAMTGFTATAQTLRVASLNTNYMLVIANSASVIPIGAYSTNGGLTWNIIPFSDSFISLCNISQDGRIMVITRQNATGAIYMSVNYGASWTKYTAGVPSLPGEPCISTDNNYLYHTSYSQSAIIKWDINNMGAGYTGITIGQMTPGGYGINALNSGRIYVTDYNSGTPRLFWVDGGVYVYGNFVNIGAGTNSAPSIAMSIDGKHIMYCRANSQVQIYVSNNYGVLWTLTTLSSTVRSMSLFVSKSGRYMGIQSLTTNIHYISNNFGATFTQYNWTVGASASFNLEET
ncbi:MAG: exo-alpha-sialidase [Saprospiraceae bacterium]|nr:exo-alpha-sialidase [Saprospiraceae bacterium]MBP6567245.1 exo-alpha-sialidase [Saprospiraceae bacterium]